jgi:translation initiation factor 4G
VCDTQNGVAVCIPDQWSPLNPEGKKRYDRDFLMELRNDPLSKKKPDNLSEIEALLEDNTKQVSSK